MSNIEDIAGVVGACVAVLMIIFVVGVLIQSAVSGNQIEIGPLVLVTAIIFGPLLFIADIIANGRDSQGFIGLGCIALLVIIVGWQFIKLNHRDPRIKRQEEITHQLYNSANRMNLSPEEREELWAEQDRLRDEIKGITRPPKPVEIVWDDSIGDTGTIADATTTANDEDGLLDGIGPI